MSRQKRETAWFFLALALAWPLRASGLTLREAMDLAVQNNVTAQLAHSTEAEARAQTLRSAAALLPNLLATVGQSRTFKTNLEASGFPANGLFDPLIGPYNTFDARLSLTQRLFDLAALRLQQADRAYAQAALETEQLAREQVAASAALAYIEALRAAGSVEAARSDADLAQTLLRLAQDQHLAGLSTGVDLARAQTRLAQENVRLIRARVASRQAELRLLRICGLSLGSVVPLTEGFVQSPANEPAPVLESAVTQALKQRREVGALEAQRRAETTRALAARAENYPTVVAAADYGFSGPLPSHSARTGSIGGRLSLPIFSGGQTLSDSRIARARQNAAEVRLADAKAQVEEDVRLSAETLMAAREELTATQSEIALAERELTMARDRFAAGAGDNIQLLSAQTSLEAARESRLNAQAGYAVAGANWALALGDMKQFHF